MSDPNAFRARYLAALALPSVDNKSASATSGALDRAHELRKFEIENYWKRATYFWAFQLAAFTVLGLVWRDMDGPSSVNRLALLVPAGLGAISAQVGWLTARGSKFWQENWEMHVDLLEGDIEGRLTQLVLSKSGAQFSVSRANENFMLLLIIGWLAVFAVVVCPALEEILLSSPSTWAISSLLLAMMFLAGWSGTNLRGSRYRTGQSEWQRYDPPSVRIWLQRTIVDRFLRVSPDAPEMVLRDTVSGAAELPKVAP